MSDLPAGFEARMRGLLGLEAPSLFDALAKPPEVGLRLNTLKLGEAEFRALVPWNLSPIPWSTVGYHLDSDVAAGKHPYHAAGLYYLQEPSAMAVADAVNPQPGELVLDLAAAPGGKATQLVSLGDDRAITVANEVHRGRARALIENLERWGAKKSVVVSGELGRLAKTWGPLFDRVLLDAPCSGEGMFRKSEEALSMWSEATVQMCARRQTGLIDEAAALVRPGGLLCYSTCTFAPEENEAVIARFLQGHPEFGVEPLTFPGSSPGRPDWLRTELSNPDLAKTARLWPHRVQGEGHFIALLRKKDGEHGRFKPASFRPLPHEVAKLWRAFKNELLPGVELEGELTLFGDKLFLIPAGIPNLKGLNALRAGLGLAAVKKNRLEPLHSLALALSKTEAESMNRLELAPDDERLNLYLQGHILENKGEDGWVLVTVSGYGLGWGRRSQGVVKNFYPKGLRRRP